ncbi:hypothetical protein C8N40_104160 [Pontibacter mucosus]|uniref:Uncharacterized protein n=1 Tax=Pontibacter mucosus TaxID=1649266 RepID=A0A2T5YJE1_9BACT|nr:hypothetical protein [Pontibacter mucosus]PTX19428.1 hypothetical protein C8N40_104160 [Pontibacter mucosus]
MRQTDLPGFLGRFYTLFCLLLLSGLAGCGKRFSHSVRQVPAPVPVAATVPDYTDSTLTLAAGEHYGRSRLHTFLYGKHYRSVWTTPVEVPVLDIGTAYGGLEPLQMGGSRQTINLRLQDSTGTEYVIRSLDKEPASALPKRLQKSYLADFIRDATSATNPYAPLALPAMAEAIGIHYLEPELVFVPHDPRLGEFMDKIGGTMALLERRPAKDQSDYDPMGNASKVKSTRSAITERLTDNDSHFDARLFLRSRLFDMLLGDWSRHEDNWRWAEEEYSDKAYVYRAIPRDRDNIFFKMDDGPVPWLLQRLGVKPHFQSFHKRISASRLEKLNRSGRNLDELILARLSWQDWQQIADSVQQALTDEVIEQAFTALPDTIHALTAASTISKLKSRRDALPQMARSCYATLAKKVQVVGTDKHERFAVEVQPNGGILVRVYKMHKDKEVQQLLYERLFHSSETRTLELYGLGGDDVFILSGDARPGMKIKVWGGSGEDHYEANSPKPASRLQIFDSKYRNRLEVPRKAKVKLSNEQNVQTFNAEGWLLRYYLD